MIRETLAKKLKEYRKKAGLSIGEVGDMIGKSRKTVSAWECCRGQPDADMLLALCELYKIKSIDELFDRPSDMPEPIEKAPELDDSSEAVIREQAEALTGMLARFGFLDESGDISDKDAEFIKVLLLLIDNHFSSS